MYNHVGALLRLSTCRVAAASLVHWAAAAAVVVATHPTEEVQSVHVGSFGLLQLHRHLVAPVAATW